MAQNKMLIDASHPEETRVVVVRGNRVEEFDFEAEARRQLRGNIYLAKITRVEPSLQAAFIDYGGNRHGFLAFSEIHPDYYQIPTADRQALLAAEADAAGDDADEDELSDIAQADAVPEQPEEVEIPEDADEADEADDAQDDDDDEDGTVMAHIVETESISEDVPDDDSGEDETDEKPVKSRTTKKTATKATKKPARKSKKSDKDEDEAAKPAKKSAKSAAKKPVKKSTKAKKSDEEEAEDKPKKRTAKKPTKSTKKIKANVEEGAVDSEAEETKKTVRRGRKPKKSAKEVEKSDDTGEEAVSGDGDDGSETDGAPARKRSAKRSSAGGRKPKRVSKKETGKDEAGEEENGNGADGVTPESVGSEDAMGEVPMRHRMRRQYKIQEVVRRRQIMLVQVVKEERGTKGAALTTYLSLAGRYAVLMPNTARGGGISRKITNSADRQKLKEVAAKLDVPQGMGVILRTAGASRTMQEIKRDFDYLMRLWDNVRNLTLSSSAPCLVYEEGSLIKRSIRDLYDRDIGEILVSGKGGFEEAKEFMGMLMPSHAKNVKLYKGEQPLFSRFGVESQLDKMLSTQVALKSGGYLVINQTEALVAIDVNSGRSTREHSIEATALQTNLEAAEEVARQLRLRDLAGLVVIDFIDMEEKRNNRSVERKLKECLKRDRARIQVGHISHFGLLEMSRQRIRASVLESTMEICSTCQGTGYVRSASSMGLQIIRGIEEHLNGNSRFDIVVKLTPANALYVLNYKRETVSALEMRYGVRIEFVADGEIGGQSFAIERNGPASGTKRRVKAAVNPMDGDSADGDTSSGEDEWQDHQEIGQHDEDERSGRKRRRRRGRGRRHDDSAYPADEFTANASTGDEDAEAGPDRNKRNSRRAKSSDMESETVEAEIVEADTDDENTRPKRRTGRPGKRVAKQADRDTDPGNAIDQADEENGEQANGATKTGAPPRATRRRNTRRVKETAPSDDGEAVDNIADEAIAEIADEPITEPADVTEEVAAKKPKKKSGFWRGGFFS